MLRKINNVLLNNISTEYYNIILKSYLFIYNYTTLYYFSLIGFFITKSKFFKIEDLYFKFPKQKLHYYGRNFRSYEIGERNFINKYIDKDDTVLELGAGVGVISCFINKKLHDKKLHLVLEPNPFLNEFLKINRKKNNCQFNILEAILSMDSKKIQFNLNYNYLSSSIYSKPNEMKSIKVETVTLNQIQQTYNTKFNTLVMDIEGQEFSVITNNNLSNFNKVIMEIHPKILSKDELEIISKKLILERFILIEKKGNVEFWKK